MYEQNKLDRDRTNLLFAKNKGIKKKCHEFLRRISNKRQRTISMVEVLDQIMQSQPGDPARKSSLHLVPHLISSSRLLMSISANSSFSFSLLNDSSLRKCFSLKSFKYLSSVHVSNGISPFFGDFSNVLNIRQGPSDIISSYIDLKPSLCILKLSPFVRVLNRPNGTLQLRLTGTLPNLKQVKFDLIPNYISSPLEDSSQRQMSDSKMGLGLDHSPSLKKSRQSNLSNASLLSNDDSIKVESRGSGRNLTGGSRQPKLRGFQNYSLRDNFKLREIFRSLRFLFRKNKLLRECVFDRFQKVMGLGKTWIMVEHLEHTFFLEDFQLGAIGTQTQDKHQAMYLKKKLEQDSEVISYLCTHLPRNTLYKQLVSRLRNKNDIVKYSRFFVQHLVMHSVWNYLFGCDYKFRDLILGIDKASYGSKLITSLGSPTDFCIRYSPNVRFFISKTQLMNEAIPIIRSVSEILQSAGRDSI